MSFSVPPPPPSGPFNPYQPPQAASSPWAVPSVTGSPVWHGSLLVVPKEARLPRRCVVCNEPAETKPFKLSWQPPWVAVLILTGLLPYIIVAIILTKRGTIHAGVCRAHRALRRNWILGGLAIFALGVWVIVVAFRSFDMGWLALPGLVLIFVGLIAAAGAAKPVKLAKIDDYYVWLKRVHQRLLDEQAPPPPPGWGAPPGGAAPGDFGQGGSA